MTVALGTTLIDLNIATLIETAEYERIEDGRCNGADIFIGALITRYGETAPDVDLCGEGEPIDGLVTGLNTTRHLLPNVDSGNAAFYNDYDNPFADNIYIRFGVLKPQGIYLVLSDTNVTIAIGNHLRVKDGVLNTSSSGDITSFVATEAVTGAVNTRKYFRARYIKT